MQILCKGVYRYASKGVYGGNMLTKKENDVMRAVYELTHEKGICLVSPTELLSLLPPKKKYTEAQVERILQELVLDDYF